MLKIAVLISGNGSNLQFIIDNIENNNLDCNIECVISDKKGAFGIERAQKHNIKTFVFDRKKYGDSISDKILETLDGKVDLIVLAGYLSIIKGEILNKFKNKIINIHPSLIPSFCGKGMYGIKVHEKALEYGVKVTGCTVHFVDAGTDTGKIILQKSVKVKDDDTPQSLQKRVLIEEHKVLTEAIKIIIDNGLKVGKRRQETEGRK